MKDHYEVLIVGGGTGGITVAARLRNLDAPPEVGIIEPSETHYYQPLWTLVGAGEYPREVTERREADFIPRGADWIRDAAATFDPENNTVTTDGGRTIGYDYLVVAAGLQLDWDRVPGLAESVGRPRTGVCSNYSYQTVASTWENIRTFGGGTSLFTEPATPVKCGGAPQKILYLADHAFRRMGVRHDSTVMFLKGKPQLFSVRKYEETLEAVVKERDIQVRLNHNLVEVRPDDRVAVFENLVTEERTEIGYDMIHVTPPQGPRDFLKGSPISNDDGWVDVHKYTLQHVRFPNIFALGDCSSLPTSKTGAAIRKQAPVVVENLLAVREGQEPTAAYDGYTSCPIITGYGKMILAEFDYDKNPEESFPFDQGWQRYSMYALKKYGLPRLYWHGMLRGGSSGAPPPARSLVRDWTTPPQRSQIAHCPGAHPGRRTVPPSAGVDDTAPES